MRARRDAAHSRKAIAGNGSSEVLSSRTVLPGNVHAGSSLAERGRGRQAPTG